MDLFNFYDIQSFITFEQTPAQFKHFTIDSSYILCSLLYSVYEISNFHNLNFWFFTLETFSREGGINSIFYHDLLDSANKVPVAIQAQQAINLLNLEHHHDGIHGYIYVNNLEDNNSILLHNGLPVRREIVVDLDTYDAFINRTFFSCREIINNTLTHINQGR